MAGLSIYTRKSFHLWCARHPLDIIKFILNQSHPRKDRNDQTLELWAFQRLVLWWQLQKGQEERFYFDSDTFKWECFFLKHDSVAYSIWTSGPVLSLSIPKPSKLINSLGWSNSGLLGPLLFKQTRGGTVKNDKMQSFYVWRWWLRPHAPITA